MELQWPLILFTTFVAASCGLFAAQGVYALKGEAKEAQMPALWTSFVLLVVGGIAVFFHLQHWERIFNGFGHITSGITQELIAIVVLVVVMIVCFAQLRRESEMTKGVAWCAIVFSAVLVIVAGHSYMMPSRPTWDSFFGPLSLLGAAAAFGPGLFAAIASVKGAELGDALTGKVALVGAAANAVLTCCYVAVMAVAGGSFTQVGYSFDPTHPNKALQDAAAYGPFAGGAAWSTTIAIVAALAALAVAIVARKKGNWKVMGAAIAVLAFAGAIALRVTFYLTGGSVFMYY